VVVALLVVAASCLESNWSQRGTGAGAVPPGVEAATALQSKERRSFVFSAAGDYGASDAAAATLEAIGRSDAAFHLALGDLSYGNLEPESKWCDFVTSRVGERFPFQLLAGNHDSDGEDEGQHIDGFRSCLPDRIRGMVGRYGKEYYFDYPRRRPLARFIMVAAGAEIGGEEFRYAREDAGYAWVDKAITTARARGIRWVVVGTHMPCLNVGEYGCAMDEDLFDLLVRRRVDLVLSGHEHSYQRSVQVALGPGCRTVRPSGFDGDCVAGDAADGSYRKGAGTVAVVVGTAGAGLYEVDTGSPQEPYMASVMGEDAQPTHGLVRFRVSARALVGRFRSSTGGDFRDSFAVVAGRRGAR
jgi:hypothetical protein